MPEKTEAQKRAQKKYMSSFVEIKVRVTPDKRTTIQEHAQAMGESATTFINRAIDHEMQRDNAGGPQEAVGAPVGLGAVSLPSETVKAAQVAAEAAGEDTAQFINRAVETQAQRDKVARGLKR